MNGRIDEPNFRHLFLRDEPDTIKPYLVSITNDRPTVDGTSVPSLEAMYRVNQGGLIVPTYLVKPAPVPIDLVAEYITSTQIFGFAYSETELAANLRNFTFGEVARWVAAVLGRAHAIGSSTRSTDLEFAEEWFASPVLEQVKDLLSKPGKILVVPQILLALLKLAARYSGDSRIRGTEPRSLVPALLSLADHLGRDRQFLPRAPLRRGGTAYLAPELVANQDFNKREDIGSLLGRFVRTWIELPKDSASDPQMLDLEKVFLETVGVDLKDLVTVTLGLLSRSISGGPVVNAHEYLAPFNWTAERIDSVLQLISCDTYHLREAILAETDKLGLDWAFSAFEQYPLIRLDQSTQLVLSPLLLLRRTFSWLPIFDILSRISLDAKEGKRFAGRVKSCPEHIAELYTAEVLRSICATLSEVRVYGDSELKAAYHKKGTQVADFAIDYGDAWVVVEVTASKLTRESAAGVSVDALERDLGKIVHEAGQIDSTIKCIRNNEEKLTGYTRVLNRKFFPLVVMASGFPVNPVTLANVRDSVASQGILQGHDVETLEVATLEDLEFIEAVQDSGGPSLRRIIELKQRASLGAMGIKEFAIFELGLSPSRPKRLDGLLQKAYESIRSEFLAAGIDAPELSEPIEPGSA